MHELDPSCTMTTSARTIVAAFDFDGTLTHGDTLLPFLIRSLGWPGFLRALVLSAPWLVAYGLRLMSNHRAKARLLQVSLTGWSQTRARGHARDFVDHYLPGQWRAWGLQQLVQHQQLGHRCVIISASPGIYLHAVAAALDVDAVLCTEMELLESRYSGRMATPNCHGEQKVIRLQAWVRDTPGVGALPELHAYGDSHGDLPLLHLADHAWYRGKPWFRT
jgi:phosphatidylglycerophosphatase C